MQLHTLLEGLLEWFFPDRCAACGGTGGLLCAGCRARLRPYPGAVARIPETLCQVQVGFVFEGPLRQAVHHLKYRRARRMARPLGELLAARLAGSCPPADGIVAVPLHPRRLAERGYNQAEELASALAPRWGVPLRRSGLARERATAQQAGLAAAHERAANMRGAFRWAGPGAPPRRALLVDDVFTTGATMAACAETLILAGSDEVYGIALARSRPDLDGLPG
jgi:ComF family protein